MINSLCYSTSIDPPNKYLSDYAKAIAICEEFFINTPSEKYNQEKYKELLLERIKYELIPSFDSVLLSQIEKYIDYYLQKEAIRIERSTFSRRKSNSNSIRDKITSLKEEIAIMDLDYGYDHFAIRKRKRQHQIITNDYTNTNRSNSNPDYNNSDIRKTNQSIEKNILIKKIIEKDKEKEPNRSQPLIESRKQNTIKAFCFPEVNKQTKTCTNHNHNYNNTITNTNGNINIISNIFTSIYQNTPQLYLNKQKLSDVESTTKTRTKTLSNKRSFNKSTNNSLWFREQKKHNRIAIDHKRILNSKNKLIEIGKCRSFIKHSHDRYKLTPNLSMQNLTIKDNNHLVSSLRSTTTNNTLTVNKGDNKSMRNTSKRTNSSTKNYSKETNEHFVKTSLLIMKHIQNSLRRDTSVPNYKPRKRSNKMKVLPVPIYKHKKIIPYVYHINKTPMMHLKDYALKHHSPKDNRSNTNDIDVNNKECKLKTVLNSFYIKMNHNILLLILLKTSSVYNKSQMIKKRAKPCQNNKVLYRDMSNNSMKSNVCSQSTLAHAPSISLIISVREKEIRHQRGLSNNKTFKYFKPPAKNKNQSNNMSKRLPFK